MTATPVLRASHMDVSNTVDVTDPEAVGKFVRGLFESRYPGFNFAPVDVLITDFAKLYTGNFPGFKACDLKYHDMQHVLDVTVAMARLIEGHEMSHSKEEQLGPEMALKGIASALFHDSGYIRRNRDTRNASGAAYTRTHVSRGARFMTEYFPTVGLAHIVPACERLIHYTGYELNPDQIASQSESERVLGNLLGTADLIAQMADANYLSKCRDYLYAEFEAGGMAGEGGELSSTGIVYQSPQHLLESTPNFIHEAITVRLDGYFEGVYRYAGQYFGGPNLYMEAIARNSAELEKLILEGQLELAHPTPL
ncbi:MAG: hypothetical protein ACI9A2_001860 [Halioglobus sp.]|jgi:hypothetical protein